MDTKEYIMANIINQKIAQQIVDTVKDVCGHNINFIDESGMIIASTDERRINTYHEIGRQVALTKTTLEVEEDTSYYGTQKGVNIPILHHGNVMAVIGISGDPDQVRKYAYLAQKITFLILRERDLDQQVNNRKNHMNYMIRALISQSAMSLEYLNDFLESHHISQNQRFYTLVIRLNSTFNQENLFMIDQQIFQTFEQTGSTLYTFNYPNEYILFLGEQEYKKSWHLFPRLAEKYGSLLKIGLGQLQPVSHQYLSYQAAKLAIHSLNSGESLAVYDQLDLNILLGNVSEAVRKAFLEKIIVGMEDEDIQLLQNYFEEDCSLKRTSNRLNMHKNTLQYRLGRIHRLCGYNPRLFRDGVVLYCAVKLKQVSDPASVEEGK